MMANGDLNVICAAAGGRARGSGRGSAILTGRERSRMETRQTSTVVRFGARVAFFFVAGLPPASALAQQTPATPAGEATHLESSVPNTPAEIAPLSQSSDPACQAGTVEDPRSHRCLSVCSDGRLEVVPGHCCWPGQDLGESTHACVGVVAYCPTGTIPDPRDAEQCLRLCPGGRMEVASGHCCWPGQTWREEARKCVGLANCPKETAADPRNPAECLRRCAGDRVEVAPGHCCRPGESWLEEVQKCVGAATCPAGTMANPRNLAECLRSCSGDRVEVAPDHCCWPGQAWNIDAGECEGAALACSAHMRLSPAASCVPLDRPCETRLDCSDDSVCLAGRCEQGRRFRRLEVFADGVPVLLGYWRVTDSNYDSSIGSGDFLLRGAAGLALRASWSVHPRWSVGGYLGYFRTADGHVDVDQESYPGTVPVAVSFRAVRLGALANYRWSRYRALMYGFGLEAGLVLGTAGSGDAPFGVEIAPDFFLDIPLGSGTPRPYLTLSFGFRAGTMDHSYALPGYAATKESWFYFMPVIRLGLGVGH